MARLSKGPIPFGPKSRPPSGKPPIEVAVRGPLARNSSFVAKSAAVAKQLAKAAPKASTRTQPRRGGRNSEDPLSGPLLR
jgi:hypothetical protein